MEEERIGLLKLKDAFKNMLFCSSWGGEESDCCFQGVLRLNKLQDLNLYPNEFTEFPSLGGLPSLTSLDLASNFLKNSNNFEELTTLSNLEVLKLGNNLITSEIASSIARLTSLKTLSLADNKLNGLWPVERMCKLKNLEELDLSACGLEGKLPPCLCNLTSIRSLELSKNNFNGTIPSTLFFSLKSLEYVSLSENLFEGLFSFSSLANNSILVVFKLASHNNLLRVETEIPRMFLPPVIKLYSQRATWNYTKLSLKSI
ncbi:receptor-like protein 9a [Camellia sinensis]|uniref:receptor-like protein 9a n=1 Tax=Camellia sinensis TaxID=4442 RepID=UPI0010357435|nr:receptor-like protein 9a [Camellia sinensis]